MGVSSERVYINFDRVGNTANASLLLCLSGMTNCNCFLDCSLDLVEENTLPDGSTVLLIAAESTVLL